MSTAQRGSRPAEQPISGWATGGITFAATMAALVGTFQILQGLVEKGHEASPPSSVVTCSSRGKAGLTVSPDGKRIAFMGGASASAPTRSTLRSSGRLGA